MRSFIKAASLIALATFGLLAPAVSAQELTKAVPNPGISGGFKDSLDPLNLLAVGPYPASASSNLTPFSSGFGVLRKRQSCQPGYGACPNNNGCCPTNELCAKNGCCPSDLQWECGGKYCCPYDSCLADGHCGCNDNLYRCGNKCCQYGCNPVGGCACDPNSSYPIQCSDGGCCAVGTTCTGTGYCQSGGGGGGNPPPPPPPPPVTPPPVTPPPVISPPPITPPPTVPTTLPSIPLPSNTTTTTTTTTFSFSPAAPSVTLSHGPASSGLVKEASISVIAAVGIVAAALIL
ncbi:hypothetical protein BGZ49_002846 [Haplosporangium sp. Z 27]|nr:hypothetical protein BGZ49_002846 [Haplosporangium sp. Z 27]